LGACRSVEIRVLEEARASASAVGNWRSHGEEGLAAFSSRYSLALYEVVALKANLQQTSQEILVATLRQWLGARAGKLSEWYDFHRKAGCALRCRLCQLLAGYKNRARLHLQIDVEQDRISLNRLERRKV
jgi:hypothetical protein